MRQPPRLLWTKIDLARLNVSVPPDFPAGFSAPDGIVTILNGSGDHSLVVRGTPAGIEKLVELLKRLNPDRPRIALGVQLRWRERRPISRLKSEEKTLATAIAAIWTDERALLQLTDPKLDFSVVVHLDNDSPARVEATIQYNDQKINRDYRVPVGRPVEFYRAESNYLDLTLTRLLPLY